MYVFIYLLNNVFQLIRRVLGTMGSVALLCPPLLLLVSLFASVYLVPSSFSSSRLPKWACQMQIYSKKHKKWGGGGKIREDCGKKKRREGNFPSHLSLSNHHFTTDANAMLTTRHCSAQATAAVSLKPKKSTMAPEPDRDTNLNYDITRSLVPVHAIVT